MMARVVQRCQEVQVRTWYSSRPVRPLESVTDYGASTSFQPRSS
jgi:hypothetical protein